MNGVNFMVNSVTNRQMVFILFLTLTAYATIDLPKIMADTAGRSSWIPILMVSVFFAVAVMIITKLNNLYQNKVMFDYSQEIVGKFFSYMIIIYFLIYFLIVGVYFKLKLVGLLHSNFLPHTPQPVMLLFGIALFGYVAHKGITNIARGFEIIGITFLIITVGMCIFMLTEGMHYNVLPLYNPADTKMFAEAVKKLIVPFGGVEILLIIPFTTKNKKAPKIAFFTLLFIGLLYVLIVESTFMILGVNNTIALNDSFIEGIKVVEIPVLERTDIFYLTFGLTSLFSGMIIVFTAVTEFACRLFAKVKRYIIVVIVCVVFFVLCLFGLNIKDYNQVFASYATIPELVSNVLIPTTLFIVAILRKRAQKNEKGMANEKK